MGRSFSRYPAAAAFPAAWLRALQCSSHRSPVCVNPINISWSCFLQGKDCYQLWLSAAPTSAPLLAENIRFPSTGGQHPTAPSFPPPSALQISLCLFRALYPMRGKSCEVPSGSNLTIFCPGRSPAHRRDAQRRGPVLGSPAPSHQLCSSRTGDQTHPRSLRPPQLRVQQQIGEHGPVTARCQQPRPRLTGSNPPCPATSSPQVPAGSAGAGG